MFCNTNMTWNSGWCAGHRAGWTPRRALERQVLVGIRAIGRSYPGQQFAEAGIAGIGAHHQRIDKEARPGLERPFSATGDGGADRDIVAGAEIGERRRRPGGP